MTKKQCFKCDTCKRTLGPTYRYNFALHLGFAHGKWQLLDLWYSEKGVPEVLWIHGRVPLKELLRKTEELKRCYGNRKQLGKHELYERKWPCACCGAPVIYDKTMHTLSCGCGVIKEYDPPEGNLWAFKRVYMDIWATKYK